MAGVSPGTNSKHLVRASSKLSCAGACENQMVLCQLSEPQSEYGCTAGAVCPWDDNWPSDKTEWIVFELLNFAQEKFGRTLVGMAHTGTDNCVPVIENTPLCFFIC